MKAAVKLIFYHTSHCVLFKNGIYIKIQATYLAVYAIAVFFAATAGERRGYQNDVRQQF
jgi:hypothetical protein